MRAMQWPESESVCERAWETAVQVEAVLTPLFSLICAVLLINGPVLSLQLHLDPSRAGILILSFEYSIVPSAGLGTVDFRVRGNLTSSKSLIPRNSLDLTVCHSKIM